MKSPFSATDAQKLRHLTSAARIRGTARQVALAAQTSVGLTSDLLVLAGGKLLSLKSLVVAKIRASLCFPSQAMSGDKNVPASTLNVHLGRSVAAMRGHAITPHQRISSQLDAVILETRSERHRYNRRLGRSPKINALVKVEKDVPRLWNIHEHLLANSCDLERFVNARAATDESLCGLAVAYKWIWLANVVTNRGDHDTRDDFAEMTGCWLEIGVFRAHLRRVLSLAADCFIDH